jgi:hypothetical protein
MSAILHASEPLCHTPRVASSSFFTPRHFRQCSGCLTCSTEKPVHWGFSPSDSDLPSIPPPRLPSLPSTPAHPHTPISLIIHFLLTLLHLPHLLITPSPLPAPPAPSHPQHLRCPRNEWLGEQWAVPDRYELPREPTPAVESSDDDSDSDDSDDPIDLIQAGAASTPEPTSYSLSQHHSDAELWQKACEEEMEAHTQSQSMALGRLLSPLGSMPLGPDGS